MHDSSDANPYRVALDHFSSEAPDQYVSGRLAAPPLQVDFGPVVRRWETLRLWYNGILISLTLIVSILLIPHKMLESLYWMQMGLAGVLANLCFFAGPVVEGYGRYFGLWNTLFSYGLFAVGLTFTAMLATLFVFALMW